MMLEFDMVEVAVEGSGDHCAGVSQLHALCAGGCAAACPTGVDQVDLCAALTDALAEHLGIDGRIHRHEGLAKQGGEGGLRLGNAALGAGELGGEAGHEVVHCSVLVQAGDGRQDAESVSRQEDNDLGDAADAGDGCVGDVVDRIADAGVLGQAAVVEVKLTSLFVHDDVLDQRAETDGVIDLRLVLFLEVDALCVAAALDVEDAVVCPAMLVVANELAVRVGGKGGLAGAGQAEEDSRLMGLGIHVRRAVHRKDVLLGQNIVHGGEDALLDLAGVLGAADDDEMCLIVDHDGSLGVNAVDLGVALEAGGSEDGVVRFAVGSQLFRGRTDEELMDEEVLGRHFIDDAELLGVLGISACKAVEDEHFAALEVSAQLALDGVELLSGDGTVHLAPGDVVMDGGGVDDELVVRRTAGGDDECAGVAQLALAAAERCFGELRGAEVAVNGLGGDDAQFFQTIGFHICFLLIMISAARRQLFKVRLVKATVHRIAL